MLRMFEADLSKVPKSRAELINEFEIPDDITLCPYIWSTDGSLQSDSLAESVDLERLDDLDLTSESSLALSRAMTDSDIDYDRYKRFKYRSHSDPWIDMRTALDNFPLGYLDSLQSFYTSTISPTDTLTSPRRRSSLEGLTQKMSRFFDEECRVFSPDDPALIALDEALHSLDTKILEAELAISSWYEK